MLNVINHPRLLKEEEFCVTRGVLCHARYFWWQIERTMSATREAQEKISRVLAVQPLQATRKASFL